MSMTVSYKHMRSSKNLLDYAKGHLEEKLEKQSGGPVAIHIRLSVAKGAKTVHVNAESHDGFHLTAKHSAESLYEAIDRVTEKLLDQWATHKGKRNSNRKRRITVQPAIEGTNRGDEEDQGPDLLEEA